VTDFGGSQEFTTWDGEPISRERPHGATIVVASRAPLGWRYLLLHRAHHGADYDGDWAWTPPSGSRKPGEEVTASAIRELREETELQERPRAVVASDVDWAVFALEIPWGTPVAMDGTEHDRLEWSPTPMLACAAGQQCWPRRLPGHVRRPVSGEPAILSLSGLFQRSAPHAPTQVGRSVRLSASDRDRPARPSDP
jgi:NUDIX domain